MRQRMVFWGGMLVSIAVMTVLLLKIDFRQLTVALGRLEWSALVPAILFTFLSFWLRAVRWRYLLIHEKPVRLASLYPAVIIGYMANNLLPARLGEFVRAWVLAQKERLPVSGVFASLVIDRMVDGMSVMVMLVCVLLTLRLPAGMEQVAAMLKTGGLVTLLVYVAALFFLFMLKIRPLYTLRILGVCLRPLPDRVHERVISLAGSFLEGLRCSLQLRHLLLIAVTSLLIWVTATLPIWFILRGFGLDLPLSVSFFIMVLLVFAVMVPAAPGYIGVYHAACYTGLKAFNVDDAQAVSIALVIHAVGFFPVILAGAYHLWSRGLSLQRLREQAAARDGGAA